MKNKALLATVAIGAAFLLRNEKSRRKLMDQAKQMAYKFK